MPAATPSGPSAPFATLSGLQVVEGSVRVPGAGAWTADVLLARAPTEPLAAEARAVELVVGDLALTGTLQPGASGDFADTGWYRLVGGGGGWSRALAARAYHNDGGLTLGRVLRDLAADAGETLTDDTLDAEVAGVALSGVDYARAAAPAARTLGELLAQAQQAGVAGATWWVDYEGTTHVGTRVVAPLSRPAGAPLDVLDYQPAQRQVELATDSLAPFAPGVVLSDGRLPADLVVRELEVVLGETLRVRAWVDTTTERARPIDNRIVRALRAAVREALPQLAYLPLARYRVVTVVAGRANLQAVDKTRGLPDLTLVRLAPGIPGATFTPGLGSVVLVAFVEGDPSQPLVVSYAPADDAAFQPTRMQLGDVGGLVKLAGGMEPVALAGPLVSFGAAVVDALKGLGVDIPALNGVASADVRAS